MTINNWNIYYDKQYNYSTHNYFASQISTIPCTMLELSQNTQSEQYTAHTPVSSTHAETEEQQKQEKCKLYYNEKREGKDLKGHFGYLSENYN